MKRLLLPLLTSLFVTSALAQTYFGQGESVSDPYRYSIIGDSSAYLDTTGYSEVSCALTGGQATMVIGHMGQSTSNNVVLGGPDYSVTQALNHQYSIRNDKCYQTRHKGLSVDSTSNWWQARLGDKLIIAGTTTRVIFAPLGGSGNSNDLAGTTVAQPFLYNRISAWSRILVNKGIPLTHVILTFGDGDCLVGITGAQYKTNVQKIIATIRLYASPKFYVPIETYHPTCGGVDASIQAVQSDPSGNFGAGVYPLGNADILLGGNRFDGVHWSETGADNWTTSQATAIAANP